MEELKTCIRKYKVVDDRIREANRAVTQLRETRKILELELGDILKSPEFTGIGSLAISDDGSTIKIQRPETWTKSWYLSKKDLDDHIKEYFASTNQPTADGCYEYILKKQKDALISKDFNFTRIVKENMDDE